MGFLFAYMTVNIFGALHFALITNSRKFFTILISVIMFKHNYGIFEFLCLILVLSATLINAFYNHLNPKRTRKINNNEEKAA